MSYLERVEKLNIPYQCTDKTDRSPPFVSFVSEPLRGSQFFSSVLCAECRHSNPATATDPHSWHSCGNASSGRLGWWGMAPHPCEHWEAKL